MNYRSYHDMYQVIRKRISQIPIDFDLVVGVPRSGIIPAEMIGSLRNIPVASLNEFLCGNIPNFGRYSLSFDRRSSTRTIKNVLIVDDSLNSGASIANVRQHVERKISKEINVFYAAIYCSNNNNDLIDYSFEQISYPRIFEWNIFSHPLLRYACLDIDGVVCDDPTEEQNDDGPRYLEFIRSAKPRIVLGDNQIGCFVTTRLEKYRAETECWLSKYFRYGDLVMLNGCSKEERQKRGLHGSFKGLIYRDRPETLFIESNWNQAKEIAQISGKPVLCVDNMLMLNPSLDKEAIEDGDSLLCDTKIIQPSETVQVYRANQAARRYEECANNCKKQFEREQSLRKHAEGVIQKYKTLTEVRKEQLEREQSLRKHAEGVIQKYKTLAEVRKEQLEREQSLRRHAEMVVRERNATIQKLKDRG